MNDINNLEFVFWLNRLRTAGKIFPKLGQFKCVITKGKVSVNSVKDKLNINELDIDINSIQKCKIDYSGGEQEFISLTANNKTIALLPINPLNPHLSLYPNEDEVAALEDVINAIRSNRETNFSPNPYLRQLSANQKAKRRRPNDAIRGENINWDKHTSPWEYYESYGDKLILLKLFANIVVSVIIVVLIGMGIVYVLALLGII